MGKCKGIVVELCGYMYQAHHVFIFLHKRLLKRQKLEHFDVSDYFEVNLRHFPEKTVDTSKKPTEQRL